MHTAAKWHNDEEMAALAGDWWMEDMELHNDATLQQNVNTANVWLEEHGSALRVVDCRDAEDFLEWKLQA